MKKKITRRDFLNGTQLAVGASLLSPWTEAFGANAPDLRLPPDYYPPAKTGLRGSHDGSWETMHTRVAGTTWPAGKIDEHYDLVVVGGEYRFGDQAGLPGRAGSTVGLELRGI